MIFPLTHLIFCGAGFCSWRLYRRLLAGMAPSPHERSRRICLQQTRRTHKSMDEQRSLVSEEVAQDVFAGNRDSQTEVIPRAIIGERVRRARIAANLTQQELAGDTYSK